CVQLNSGPDMAANLASVGDLVRQAQAGGADLVMLPENSALMAESAADLRASAVPQAEHPAVAACAELARQTGVWLLAGTLGVGSADGRVAPRSFLFDAEGEIAARYDKIHMFDVDLPEGEVHRESKTFEPGDRAVLAATPWGLVGLTVCYDLRFPQLYRALAKDGGADFLSVPSAFTRPTGEAHWHVLLRARAIETGCFVVAPAQCGRHPRKRQTYGHSLIVDPWGKVVAEAGTEV
ncbi:MAG: carbon-nitrogen hydrolase family protein, partial [Alphaproteobacteria bacterium]|nr:carbon-nitrogen hydrolase family protein [Alphaproteobacteria bacterium]